jgi:ribA/ribD-fused uncharacterized protein
MFSPAHQPGSHKVSYMDTTSPLSAWSKHAIYIEDLEWPSVEHYRQAMKFENAEYREKIRAAQHPKDAKRLGELWWKRKKSSWKSEREIYMTRGMYIKCKTHPEVTETLMASDDLPILDTSNFDYFWGCGRDGRGANRFGAVLTDIRAKLRAETRQPS